MISKRKTFLAERSERTVRLGSRSTEWGGARTGKDERGTLPEWRAERTGKDDSKGESCPSGELVERGKMIQRGKDARVGSPIIMS